MVFFRMHGTVLCGSNNFFDVECDDGVTRSCSIKGKKLKASEGYYNPLAPGDRVETETDALGETRGQITGLLPRKNVFVRWNVKGRSPQLLAANLDYLLCVTTPDYPPFRPRFVDRMLIQAEEAGIEPIIICNKCDLPFDPDTEYRLGDWERIGYRILHTSARTGKGIDVLSALTAGKLCAFVGQSGVGKSSIINTLDAGITLRTGGLSEKYERGTHTTTKGVLCRLNTKNGKAGVIDTPGIRRFVLNGIEADDLIHYFREMAPLSGTCSFGMSCTHTHEAGCKVLEAVYAGVICEERYESWQRICDEITGATWDD